MAKYRTPTPQEIYRQRKQREEQEKTARLPPGLINHGNTCFMNSVLQGLIATQLLWDLVLFNPIPPEIQRTASTPIVSRRSPQLTNGHELGGAYEQPWVSTMPIGDMFLTVLYKAWQSQGARRRDIISPRPILGALGKKYDQYLDFAQQDAHEFLRILLDAMRMEEQDIIKKRQPPLSPGQHKKRRRTTITSSSPLDDPDDLPLISFADMLFGGQLTSILVCQKCKHVSQSYEEFNDISLSIKAEDYLNNRKRDRFRKIVGRLTQFPGTSSSSPPNRGLGIAGLEKGEKARTNLPAAVEMQRSSSVPPSPRADGKPLGEEPITDGPRRRSLDVHPVGGMEPLTELPGQTTPEREDNTSDHSHVIVNVIGPEDKHVEFVEPTIGNRREGGGDSAAGSKEQEPEKETEKEKAQDGWAKIGRRISMTVGLGRSWSERESKKDIERKTRSMDRSGLTPVIKEGAVLDPVTQTSLAAPASTGRPSLSAVPGDLGATMGRISSDNTISLSRTAPTPTPELANGIPPRPSSPSKSSKPPPLRSASTSSSIPNVGSIPPLQRLPTSQAPSLAPIASTSIFPNVQRSKSPKPPKPSAAETEYLRKILADVTASPASSNPFAIFKPPLLHSHSSYHPRTVFPGNSPSSTSRTPGSGLGGAGGEKDKSPNPAAWLGMGVRSFSGIEECLRMFTAVEVLDGENMVGCRRCWKIKNGMLHSESKGKDSDEHEEDEEDQPKHSGSPPVEAGPMLSVEDVVNERNPPTIEREIRRRPLRPLSTSIIANSIPIFLSTPTVSFYTHPNSSDTRSVSSLPTEPTSGRDNDGNNSSEDSPLFLSAVGSETSLKSESDTDVNIGTRKRGPGGLPIPVISTTAPPDTPTATADSVAESRHAISTSESAVGAGSRGPSPHPRLTQALYGYNPSSGSKDSLGIPIRKSKPQRKTYSDATTTDDNDSSDDSDTSVSTSVSAESVVERDASLKGQQINQEQVGDIGMAKPVTVSPAPTPQGSQPTSAPMPPPPAQKKAPKPPKPVIMCPAYKRYLIAVPPPVLVIHLKRFQQTSKMPLMSFSHGFKKLEDYVSFPEYLDLLPFLAPRKEDYGLGKKKGKEKGKDTDSRKMKAKEERCMYRLYAVVVHIGNMLGGHYIAYTALPPDKNPTSSSSTSATAASEVPNGASSSKSAGSISESAEKESPRPASAQPPKPIERQWAYISDTVVRLTSLEEVLHAKAYICMYERC